MLSVLIASRNEKYLKKTIENVLENAEGEIEVLVALDEDEINKDLTMDDERVTFIKHEVATGQRPSLNELARLAKGKYIMKLDAHCAVDKGFDVKLAADCEYDWTVVPTMYNLDSETWLPKMHKKTNYMYISSMTADKPFRAMYLGSKQPKNDKMIDDIMVCMGPGWFMHKDRFWELGGCDEGHSHWGQQGIEVALKAWLSGGRLVVNKKTWFAHWFRGGGGPGFPYPISGRSIMNSRDYSQNLWLNNKWDKQTRKLEWLIKKFNPPGWNMIDEEKRFEANCYLYKHIHREKHPSIWKGVPILKMPSDLMMYHKVIWETKPDYIIEIGTKYGGSALFFQDTLDMIGKGKVITIDRKEQVKYKDPRIEYLIGDSISKEIIEKVKGMVSGNVMLVIDGKHTRVQVKWELKHYSPLINSGQYVVIEDCYVDRKEIYGPGEARDWFLRNYKQFKQTELDKYFLVGVCLGGWLRKK